MRPSAYLIRRRISETHTLFINGLSGAIDVVDARIERAICDERSVGSVDPTLLDKLLARGHLVSNKRDEESRVERVFETHRPKRRMLRFSISPTYSCNLRCVYCFEKGKVGLPSPIMSPKDVDLAFDAIRSISAGEPDLPKVVVLFGGEPLLPANRRAVRRVFELAKESGISVSISTNGTNVPAFERELRSYASLLNVQITLDGPERIHDQRRITASGKGTFSSVVRSVNFLLGLGIAVTLRVNVDAQNQPFLSGTVDMIRALGWFDDDRFRCNLAPVVDHTASGDYPYLLDEWALVEPILDLIEGSSGAFGSIGIGMFRSLKHIRASLESGGSSIPQSYYCEANNFEAFEFGPDGLIYACSECMGNEEQAIGRYKPKFELFEEKVALWSGRNVATIEKCRKCELAFFCGGGCAHSALVINGSLYDPYCGSIRKLIDVYIDRVAGRILERASELNPSFAELREAA